MSYYHSHFPLWGPIPIHQIIYFPFMIRLIFRYLCWTLIMVYGLLIYMHCRIMTMLWWTLYDYLIWLRLYEIFWWYIEFDYCDDVLIFDYFDDTLRFDLLWCCVELLNTWELWNNLHDGFRVDEMEIINDEYCDELVMWMLMSLSLILIYILDY